MFNLLNPSIQPHHQEQLINAKNAATILGTTPGTLAVWRCTGRYNLPFVKIGKCVKYRLSDVNAFIEKQIRYGHNDALINPDEAV